MHAWDTDGRPLHPPCFRCFAWLQLPEFNAASFTNILSALEPLRVYVRSEHCFLFV